MNESKVMYQEMHKRMLFYVFLCAGITRALNK
jgi:hypothetical protein